MSPPSIGRTGSPRRLKITVDSQMEINRAVSIFLATTEVLYYVAIMMLAVGANDTNTMILKTNEDQLRHLAYLPRCLTIFQVNAVTQGILLSLVGIYGFATLKRHVLAYYFFVLILLMCWFIYFSTYICLKDDSHKSIIELYKNYDTSEKAKKSVHTVQRKFQCCGSKYHNFENYEGYKQGFLPESCCENTTSVTNATNATIVQCLKKDAFKMPCPINRTTVYTSMREEGSFNIVAIISCSAFCVAGLQAALTFHMIYKLNLQIKMDALGLSD